MVPLTVNFLRSQWSKFIHAHPLTKGMISYAIIWPTGSLIHQTIEGKNLKTYDWMRCLRFCLFGTFYVAPSLYGWVRLTSAMWPQTTLKVGVMKALIEQFTYGPFTAASFFFSMSLLEMKSFKEAVEEVNEKLLPTYRVAVCVWPIAQTINFSMIPERNRVVFVSICSLMWTTFLAFMKKQEITHEQHSEAELLKSTL